MSTPRGVSRLKGHLAVGVLAVPQYSGPRDRLSGRCVMAAQRFDSRITRSSD